MSRISALSLPLVRFAAAWIAACLGLGGIVACAAPVHSGNDQAMLPLVVGSAFAVPALAVWLLTLVRRVAFLAGPLLSVLTLALILLVIVDLVEPQLLDRWRI